MTSPAPSEAATTGRSRAVWVSGGLEERPGGGEREEETNGMNISLAGWRGLGSLGRRHASGPGLRESRFRGH